MKEAGLTVGGFYKHFDSRDELVAEALSDAFGVWQRQKEAAEATAQPLTFAKLIDDYLSDVHRKNPGAGCAFSALAPEIAPSDRTRALTSEQVQNDLELLAGLLPGNDKRAVRSRAILTFSALVGAMSLARAVSDESLSREIQNTVAELLKEFVSEHHESKTEGGKASCIALFSAVSLGNVSPNMGRPLTDSALVASSCKTSQCSLRRPSSNLTMSAAIQAAGLPMPVKRPCAMT